MELDTSTITDEEWRKFYAEARTAFAQAVSRAERVSLGSGGIASPTAQHYWASVLFTRMVVTVKSIQMLVPDWKPRAHCDFSAIASITRNLAECFLFYFFLCIDDVPQIEQDARIILLNLHDDGSRGRLMGEIDLSEPDEETIKARAEVRDDLETKFKANAYLAALPEKRQRELLRGEKTPFVQDDVIERTSFDKKHFRMLYRLYSAHTHTGPIAFYRMGEHGRGHGFMNPHDAKNIAFALEFATELMRQATEGTLGLFSEAEKRGGKIKSEEMRNRGATGRRRRI